MLTTSLIGDGGAFAAGGMCCICGFYGTFALLGLLSMAFWIWMLVDCVTKEPSEGNDKVMWILVIVLTGIIGAAIYFFVRRGERKRKFGR